MASGATGAVCWESRSSRVTRNWLMVEFVLLFVGLPLAYRFAPLRVPALPLLWVVAAYALWQLLRDKRFDRARLWNAGPLPAHLGAILAIFAVGALVLWLGVRRFAPQMEWSLVRQDPVFWGTIMVGYPLFSV